MSPGQSEPPGKTGGGAHSLESRPGRRLPGRKRWFVAAGVLAAFTGMVAPPAQSEDLVAVGHADDFAVPRTLAARWAIPALSEGAPRGATALTAVPAHAPGPQTAPEAVVTGLAANGIPNVALNAYRVAAARMATAKSECGIDWSLLAGIGRVESNHGRYGGAVLGPDGSATPKILGPALDGGQFAFIGDSDDGIWDDDTTYDRAMGPMQFIPTTWRSYAIDADENGVTDPFNINDAALAAANYLCVAGGNLRTDGGQRKAVLAYNHSDEYADEVLALARAYAAGMPVADLPIVGNTSGAVPPPSAFYGAPAAPWARDRTAGHDDVAARADHRPRARSRLGWRVACPARRGRRWRAGPARRQWWRRRIGAAAGQHAPGLRRPGAAGHLGRSAGAGSRGPGSRARSAAARAAAARAPAAPGTAAGERSAAAPAAPAAPGDARAGRHLHAARAPRPGPRPEPAGLPVGR